MMVQFARFSYSDGNAQGLNLRARKLDDDVRSAVVLDRLEQELEEMDRCSCMDLLDVHTDGDGTVHRPECWLHAGGE